VTYAELRAVNARAYCRQNAALFGLIPTWGPLWNCAGQMSGGDPQSLFNQIHDAGIQAIAAQTAAGDQVDWSQTYALIKPLLEAEPGRSHQFALGRSGQSTTTPLIAAIQSARWELVTSAAAHDESLTLTTELLARHIRDAFFRAGFSSRSRQTAIDPSTLLAAIITAVLGVICPPTAAFSAILEPIIAVIIKVLFSSLTTQFTSGTYGAAPDAFNAQVQQWAQEAAALCRQHPPSREKLTTETP
jgi:hypothetical protein